jgi:hypothetical protein
MSQCIRKGVTYNRHRFKNGKCEGCGAKRAAGHKNKIVACNRGTFTK